MTTISSHVLDSVIGDHARAIRIECFRLTGDVNKEKIFDVIANEEGRIAETVDSITVSDDIQYELVFHSAAYFQAKPDIPKTRQIMNVVVVRFMIPEATERIHIPMMLSPHSYNVWWSE